uniref:DoxX family protein n=1 Tax=Streptomyces sp. SNA15896 TaxID=497689 RepID=D2KTZ0_9ACTN|nr:hypothetical protein [Streptomyces sp. SNA15896]
MKLPRAGTWIRTLLAPAPPPNRAARRAGPARRASGLARDASHLVPTVSQFACGASRFARETSRFGLVYSGLYCLTNSQILPSLLGGGLGHRRVAVETWSKVWGIRPVRSWVASHVFRTEVDDRFEGGDNRYAWVGQACWLGAAAAVTSAWSALDRRHTGYDTARPWIELAVRLCLAGQMIYYGAAKAIPLQFKTPLSRFVEPLGNLSPMDLLWAQSGHSTAYQILLGCAEISGGLLLLQPRTATLGALLSALELAQVFILNMTFDVPVKLHSFHLLLLSLVLLAPESARLARSLLADQEVRLAPRPRLLRNERANRIAEAAQVAAGLWLLGAQLRNNWGFWEKFGGGGEKPALYGIWHVDEFSVDGEPRPPLTTDPQRWRHVMFDSGDLVAIQRMDDSLDTCLAAHAPDGTSLTLLKMTDPEWKATVSVERPADDRLTLDGDVDGAQVRVRLHRLDLRQFPLIGRGFHWVQESSSLR